MEQRKRTNMFFFNIMSGLYLTNNRGFPLYILQCHYSKCVYFKEVKRKTRPITFIINERKHYRVHK